MNIQRMGLIDILQVNILLVFMNIEHSNEILQYVCITTIQSPQAPYNLTFTELHYFETTKVH